MKKLTALFLALLLAAQCAVVSFADTPPYSVVIQAGKASFYQNGRITGTYNISSQDITLLTDESNDLLVCFTDQNNQFVGVTLGSQSSVTLSGSINRLLLNRELNRNVVLNSSCKVTKLDVLAPVQVTIYGNVDTLTASNSARITAAGSSDIGQKNVTGGARITEGNLSSSSSNSSNSSSNTSTSTSNGYTFKTSALYADYKDTLWDIEDDLEDNIDVYYNGNRVYGEFRWDDSRSTVLRRTGSYDFKFIPDNSRYKTAYGTIKVRVDDDDDDDDDDLDLDVDGFTVYKYNAKLSDYLDELEDNVVAYDDDDDEVKGTVRWVSGSDRIRKTGWYKFIFKPKSSRYNSVRDEIKITLRDDDDDDDDGELDLEIDDIEITSTSKRLRNLQDELEDSVKAYNQDGKRIHGDLEWVKDDDTRVRKTGDYKFRFTPDDKDYDSVTDWITIYVDD